ncbi:hypothetical protein IFR04_008936 [Cadophora malorum]|uniref:Cenp-O kinetochore centromere component n=1 Tax=Cadophora malorum TaxID=108018 RepID=A0A8H7TDT5_9HELO|nr:hypothetical protein IFR04_008936 [Cadophora malorum]
MLPSTDDTSASDAIGSQLDEEISSLQAQITSVKSQRKLQAATILSSRHTKATLTRLRASQKSTQQTQSQPSTQPTDTTPLLLAASTSQRVHTQENLYRACAGITTFRVQDPDPNAVDGGNILGLRIDVSSTGKFIKPYYILLNKPFPGTDLLRIHRHTVPPSIPLPSLAEKYLPNGKGSAAMSAVVGAGAGAKKQDLRRFVRALRREIVGCGGEAVED